MRTPSSLDAAVAIGSTILLELDARIFHFFPMSGWTISIPRLRNADMIAACELERLIERAKSGGEKRRVV